MVKKTQQPETSFGSAEVLLVPVASSECIAVMRNASNDIIILPCVLQPNSPSNNKPLRARHQAMSCLKNFCEVKQG